MFRGFAEEEKPKVENQVMLKLKDNVFIQDTEKLGNSQAAGVAGTRITAHQPEWPCSKNIQAINAEEDVEKRETLKLFVGM